MSQKFSKAKLNNLELHPEKNDYYKSGRIDIDHIDKPTEIKSSIPIQVRINGGEWVDVRQLDPEN